MKGKISWLIWWCFWRLTIFHIWSLQKMYWLMCPNSEIKHAINHLHFNMSMVWNLEERVLFKSMSISYKYFTHQLSKINIMSPSKTWVEEIWNLKWKLIFKFQWKLAAFHHVKNWWKFYGRHLTLSKFLPQQRMTPCT